jgi:hypothetical protein
MGKPGRSAEEIRHAVVRSSAVRQSSGICTGSPSSGRQKKEMEDVCTYTLAVGHASGR